MKKAILFGIFLCLFSSFVSAQAKKQCPVNSDNSYNRQTTLEKIAKMLNDSIPEFKKSEQWEFSAQDEKAKGFSIYDLTASTNTNSTKNENCLNFVNNHVYHVYPNLYDFSFSHIVVLEEGELKTFKSVNCQERGDSIENVLDYLKLKLSDDLDKIKIMERVKDYRKYGSYARICPMARIQCNQIR